ncbi:hypothetical protein DPMN_009115 [Dreissena polymorpha]|uniref:Uncharacterized protein n=1 Tax=Dreissena polymorpha TaxID=45954 RepID=A0A9D4MXH0_DREPO|nr:hypothetical protein DPMN_009115 [Dreissena polymorpha]
MLCIDLSTGAFLIPFVVMTLLCGLPLYFLEYSLPKFAGKGPYKIWDICPLFRGIGITVVVGYCMWMAGTTVMRCWIIDFLVGSFQSTLPWTVCDNPWNTPSCKMLHSAIYLYDNSTNSMNLFDNITHSMNLSDNSTASHVPTGHNSSVLTMASGNVSMSEPVPFNASNGMTSAEEYWQYHVLSLSSGISDWSNYQWRHVVSMLVIRFVIFFGLIKSIKSIEKVIYVTATVPFFLTVAIFIRSVMLPGASDGLFYFFNPDFSKIIQPRVWIEATLMGFYTLGFGWGGNMLLGSHAHFKENCLRTAVVLPLANVFMAVFSGLVCFSVLGNMAHSFNSSVTDVISGGMSVGVVSYITALSSLPVPQLWTVLFVTAILLTGIDGQLIPMDMMMQLIGDLWPGARRIPTLVATGVVFFIASIPTCSGAGAYIFLWVDWYSGAWVGPIVSIIELVTVAWIYGMDRFEEDIRMMIGRGIPAPLRFLTAFLSPVFVLVIFLTSCVEYVAPSYGDYHFPALARGLGWVSVVLVILPIPFLAAWTVNRAKGSTLLKKFQTSLRPVGGWGPCERHLQTLYNIIHKRYEHRTLFDLLKYNLSGRKFGSQEPEEKLFYSISLK